MQYTVTHHDVPIGTVALTTSHGMVAGDFVPLPAYEPVRALVRDATRTLWDVGLFGAPADGGATPDGAQAMRALERAASLHLELRDALGRHVPTVFVNVLESPTRHPELTAVVRFAYAHAAVGATRPGAASHPGDARPPEA